MPNIIIQRVVRTKRNKQVLFVDNTQYNNNNDMYKICKSIRLNK